MTKEERGFLKSIEDAQGLVVTAHYDGCKPLKRHETAASKEARLVYADWLEEHGRRADAAKQRAKAGASVVKYVGVDKDGVEVTNRYNAAGKVYNMIGHSGILESEWRRERSADSATHIVMLEIRSFLVESRPLSEYKKK